MATERKRKHTPHQPTGQWISTEKRHAIYERDDYRCQHCNRDLRGAPASEITLDHIRMQAHGGSNEPLNLLTACHTCNSQHRNLGNEEVMAKKARRNSTVAPEDRLDDQFTPGGSPQEIDFRNRILEYMEIDSSQILDHPLNPRKHTNQQRAAMKGVLSEIGIADAVLVYKSQRAGGAYVAIDGHMRKNDFSGQWPCLVLDLDDAEADLYIQVHDPVSQMANTDLDILNMLRDKAEFDDASVRVMLDGIGTWQPGGQKAKGQKDDADPGQDSDPNDEPIPEMELQPYEHYDYLLVLATSSFDWNFLVGRFDLESVDGSTDPRHRKFGLGRAITADVLIRLIRERDQAVSQLAALQQQKLAPAQEVS